MQRISNCGIKKIEVLETITLSSMQTRITIHNPYAKLNISAKQW